MSKNDSLSKKEIDDKSKNDLNEEDLIVKYIEEIKKEKTKINAIKHLSKFSEKKNNLAIYLWYSTGTITAILQEIIDIYQYLSPPKLTQEKANEVCAAISLFQCVASHPETKQKFIESQLPIFLYPFLLNTYKSNPYEYLKLTTLGVIGALVKVNDSKIISFLTGSEIIPLCLRIIERGADLSKCVASFILLRIAINDCGFKYICENEKRFYIIAQVLGITLKNKITPKLIKYIIRILARLSENKEKRNILKDIIYEEIKGDFSPYLDDSSKKWLKILKKNIEDNHSLLDINIEKLKNDLTNKNEGLNDKNFNSNNGYQKNIINGDLMNNNMNTNLMLINQMNQMNQPKFIFTHNNNDVNNFNGNINYMNKLNYNQSSNNGYNMNFSNMYKNG
jgi:CCR4-NOT transcription complex subunit 9